MPVYSYDHIHLRSRDPMATAQYYQKMFDAKIIESIQSDGQPRIDLDINGLTVFLARVPADAKIGESPVDPTSAWTISGSGSTTSMPRMPSSNSVGPISRWNHAPSAPASRSPLCAAQITFELSCWNDLDPSLAGKTPTAFGFSFPVPSGRGSG